MRAEAAHFAAWHRGDPVRARSYLNAIVEGTAPKYLSLVARGAVAFAEDDDATAIDLIQAAFAVLPNGRYSGLRAVERDVYIALLNAAESRGGQAFAASAR